MNGHKIHQTSVQCYVWDAMLQAFHKLNPKLKTVSEPKSALQLCSRCEMTCIRQGSTKPFMTFANVWMLVLWPVVCLLNISY